jgi:hypothetical protein
MVDLNDSWWDDKVSDDNDAFEEDYCVDRASSSTMPQTDESVEGDGKDGDRDGYDGTKVEGGGESEGILGDGDGNTEGDCGNCMTSFEEEEVDDVDSEMGRSDILLSPAISDGEDGGISSHLDLEFQEVDLLNPNLKLKMKFCSIQFIR